MTPPRLGFWEIPSPTQKATQGVPRPAWWAWPAGRSPSLPLREPRPLLPTLEQETRLTRSQSGLQAETALIDTSCHVFRGTEQS